MKCRKLYLSLLIFIFSLIELNAQISLNKTPIEISKSTSFQKSSYYLVPKKSDEALITITGNNIVVDFNDATIYGSKVFDHPDEFSGIAILIKNGKNITLKNVNIKAYKIAVLIENVKGLIIDNCDFSYNYRPELYSQREYENYSDWLSYHNNEKGEWKRYGSAIYMENCDSSELRNIKIHQGFNGIMLNGCTNSLIWNSEITYNSGVGVALYRSSHNNIMHNKIDWNVRGHSNGFYKRGQDSAGILVYEQSNNNVFAYNSVTHCGDGFFLWAGQSTMDSGKGGCNDNLIYNNDFSYAPTNGIELTFSRNVVYNNVITNCENGIWGGYSYNSIFFANRFFGNKRDIAIEHGQDNSIRLNLFRSSNVGIELWQNPNPQSWGYSQSKNVDSRGYDIARNKFENVLIPFVLSLNKDITIAYNQVLSASELMKEAYGNTNLVFNNNDIRSTDNWGSAEKLKEQNQNNIHSEFTSSPKEYTNRVYSPAVIPGGYIKDLKLIDPHGIEDVIINKWGPYNFEYPLIYLDEKKNDLYTLKILGPKGKYKLKSSKGINIEGLTENSSPGPFNFRLKNADTEDVNLVLEWKGEAFTDQYGQFHKAGDPFLLKYSNFKPKMKWHVGWYEIPKAVDISNLENVEMLLKNNSACTDTVDILNYAWWSAPCRTLNSGKFLTKAESRNRFEPDQYTLFITSDDGVIVYIDGKEIFKNWTRHESKTDKISMHLEGEHTFRIIHFNTDDFGSLQLRIEKGK